jgi:hypothetical protein
VQITWKAGQVLVLVSSGYSSKTAGLCGNFDGNANNDKALLNGTLVSSVWRFASNWTIPSISQSLFVSASQCADFTSLTASPPSPCGESEFVLRAYVSDYCNLLLDPSGPMAPCHSIVNATFYYESCMYDMCGRGQDNVYIACQSFDAYVATCIAANVSMVTPYSCGSCTRCSSWQYTSATCTTVTDATCHACKSCIPGSEFRKKACSEFADTVCLAYSTCSLSQYQLVAPTATTDRICANLTKCVLGQYEATAATGTSDRICASVSVCGAEYYEIVPPTATSDRVCRPRTVCHYPDTQYESDPGTATSDRTCTGITRCLADPYGLVEVTPPTPTSNRVCRSCNGVTEYQNENDQLQCKPVTCKFTPATPTSNSVCTCNGSTTSASASKIQITEVFSVEIQLGDGTKLQQRVLILPDNSYTFQTVSAALDSSIANVAYNSSKLPFRRTVSLTAIAPTIVLSSSASTTATSAASAASSSCSSDCQSQWLPLLILFLIFLIAFIIACLLLIRAHRRIRKLEAHELYKARLEACVKDNILHVSQYGQLESSLWLQLRQILATNPDYSSSALPESASKAYTADQSIVAASAFAATAPPRSDAFLYSTSQTSADNPPGLSTDQLSRNDTITPVKPSRRTGPRRTQFAANSVRPTNDVEPRQNLAATNTQELDQGSIRPGMVRYC